MFEGEKFAFPCFYKIMYCHFPKKLTSLGILVKPIPRDPYSPELVYSVLFPLIRAGKGVKGQGPLVFTHMVVKANIPHKMDHTMRTVTKTPVPVNAHRS